VGNDTHPKAARSKEQERQQGPKERQARQLHKLSMGQTKKQTITDHGGGDDAERSYSFGRQ
jgi:hypothetical protein